MNKCILENKKGCNLQSLAPKTGQFTLFQIKTLDAFFTKQVKTFDKFFT